MSRTLIPHTEDIEIFLLSLQAVSTNAVPVDDEGKQVSIKAHHIPLILDAASKEEAERQGEEHLKRQYPADEGWVYDVNAVPIIIAVTVGGTMNGDKLNLHVKIEPRAKEA
jgi:hypothetical protein